MKYILCGFLYVFGVSQADDTTTASSKVENPFDLHPTCLTNLNSQINEEMHASLVYMNMASYFDTLAVSRKGFHSFFEQSSKHQQEIASKLTNYITSRGGYLNPLKIQMPTENTYASVLQALQAALTLEQNIFKHLYSIHGQGNSICDDHHLIQFLENGLVLRKTESISKLKRLIGILSTMNTGMGEFLLDKELNKDKLEL